MNKALIAAGGHATRLRPITTTVNKHLIPLANKPMIFYALEKIAEAGIADIAININPGDKEMEKTVGDGSRWGVRITYIEQQGGPLGIAHVVANARDFLGDSPFMFFLGDNLVRGSIKNFIERFEREDLDLMLALARVTDPKRFGVPVIQDGKIIRIEEKPENPTSNLVQTGVYLYSKRFFEAFKNIKPSARGEYEISDVNTWLIQHGAKIGWEEIPGYWKDTGKPSELLEGNQLLMNELITNNDVLGEVDSQAVLQGKLQIGPGTRIGPGVLIRGPVVIGDNCVIEQSYIGPYTCIGNNVQIRNTEIENTIVFDGAVADCNKRIVDSLVGFNARIVASSASLPLGHKMIVGDDSIVEI